MEDKTEVDKLFGVVPIPSEARIPENFVREKGMKGIETLEDFFGLDPASPTRSQGLAIIKGIPGTLGRIGVEFAAGNVSPEAFALGAFGKAVGKASNLKVVQQSIVKTKAGAGSLIPEWVKRQFVYAYGQSKFFTKAAEERLQAVADSAEAAEKLGVKLSQGIDLADQKLLSRMMSGKMSADEEAVFASKGIKSLAKEARKMIDDLSTELVDEGVKAGTIPIKTASTINSNKGFYLPRIFKIFKDKELVKKIQSGDIKFNDAIKQFVKDPKELAKLTDEALASAEASVFRAATDPSTAKQFGNGLAKNRLKNRKLTDSGLDTQIRTALGEIQTAAEPAAQAVRDIGRLTANSKFINQVFSGLNEMGVIKDRPFLSHVKLNGDITRLGKLSGKYLPKSIVEDLTEIIGETGPFMKWYGKYHSAWKFGKVVANPATQMRNIMSNGILLNLSGIPIARQPKLLTEALDDYLKAGKWFTEAKNVNLLGNELVGSEIQNLQTAFNSGGSGLGQIMNMAGSASRSAGKFFQGSEQTFKLAKFIWERKRGASVKEAAKEAEKWLFNYNKVPKIVKTLRSSPIGAPFITFSSKALPLVGEVALTNPMRLYKWHLWMKAIDAEAMRVHGLSQEDLTTIKKSAFGQSVVMPFTDSEGRPMMLDLSFILPWGDLIEPGSNSLTSAINPGRLAGQFFSGPAVSAVEAATGTRLSSKVSNIFGAKEPDSDIFKPGDAPFDRFRKGLNHFGRAMLPALAPAVRFGPQGSALDLFDGGYSYAKLVNSIEGIPGRYGQRSDVKYAFSSAIAGLKMTPADLQQATTWENIRLRRAVKDAKSSLFSVKADQSKSDEEKRRIIDRIFKKLQTEIAAHQTR